MNVRALALEIALEGAALLVSPLARNNVPVLVVRHVPAAAAPGVEEIVLVLVKKLAITTVKALA